MVSLRPLAEIEGVMKRIKMYSEPGKSKENIDSYFQNRSEKAVEDFIESYWDQITIHQPSDVGLRIGLPHPFLVPNKDMFQEMYYWDSFFTCVGLVGSSREQLIIDTTENFFALIDRFGKIPNSSRFYHLGRSQPPFLSSLVSMSLDVMEHRADASEANQEWLTRAVEALVKEYWGVWRGTVHPDEREVYRGLSRYSDMDLWSHGAEAESGWDMTPRFFDRCLDFIPIDLNSLLYKYEKDIARFSSLLGKAAETAHWEELASKRAETVRELCWDDSNGFFFDFDYKKEQRSSFQSLAGFFPMWAGLATPEQAERMVTEALSNFEKDFGLVTTEEWHTPEGEVPRQWAWPNGWAPLHWIVVGGLERYGYQTEANRIASKWVDLVASVYEQDALVYEKYDVVSGARGADDRYPTQTGFGWTNGVFSGFTRYLRGDLMLPI
ncbi:alpha,alpha-trehalase [bacterium]|nr:alpha,alpha-trehalase [bacterium]